MTSNGYGDTPSTGMPVMSGLAGVMDKVQMKQRQPAVVNE